VTVDPKEPNIVEEVAFVIVLSEPPIIELKKTLSVAEFTTPLCVTPPIIKLMPLQSNRKKLEDVIPGPRPQATSQKSRDRLVVFSVYLTHLSPSQIKYLLELTD